VTRGSDARQRSENRGFSSLISDLHGWGAFVFWGKVSERF
jgi:hypothetical protein